MSGTHKNNTSKSSPASSPASSIDVRDLASERLAVGKFPASSRADFRLFLAPEVRQGIDRHAQADVSVEICGVLVGRWEQDDDGPFAVVTDFIGCDNASSKFAEVTFTHESWAQINKEMDTRYTDKRIVGWYHSHPDFGIFLSDRDCFIQENFFSGPGQVAFVVDPVRKLEGVFAWRGGKPVPMSHYWVGDEIRTVEATARPPAAGSTGMSAATDQPVSPAMRERASLSLPMFLLAGLAIFLLGYLYSGWLNRWQRETLTEGVVAHYGINKLMRFGMEKELAEIRARLSGISGELESLPEPTAELSPQALEEATKRRRLIADNLVFCERRLGQIQEQYGNSPVELAALAQFVAQKQAELRQRVTTSPRPSTGDKPANNSAPTANPTPDSAPTTAAPQNP
jgi:proteasome lid subunit RPN8/RPN11